MIVVITKAIRSIIIFSIYRYKRFTYINQPNLLNKQYYLIKEIIILNSMKFFIYY